MVNPTTANPSKKVIMPQSVVKKLILPLSVLEGTNCMSRISVSAIDSFSEIYFIVNELNQMGAREGSKKNRKMIMSCLEIPTDVTSS